jgi:hypothetical protein
MPAPSSRSPAALAGPGAWMRYRWACGVRGVVAHPRPAGWPRRPRRTRRRRRPGGSGRAAVVRRRCRGSRSAPGGACPPPNRSSSCRNKSTVAWNRSTSPVPTRTPPSESAPVPGLPAASTSQRSEAGDPDPACHAKMLTARGKQVTVLTPGTSPRWAPTRWTPGAGKPCWKRPSALLPPRSLTPVGTPRNLRLASLASPSRRSNIPHVCDARRRTGYRLPRAPASGPTAQARHGKLTGSGVSCPARPGAGPR